MDDALKAMCNYIVDMIQSVIDTDVPTTYTIDTLNDLKNSVDDIISNVCDELGIAEPDEDDDIEEYDIDEFDDYYQTYQPPSAHIPQPHNLTLSEAEERKAARAAFRAKQGNN